MVGSGDRSVSWGGNGDPQVDCFDERESPGMKRELKEIGLQADFVGERKLFAHCLLIAELIKLRKFFTHCQLKEVLIKLKQVLRKLIKLRKFLMDDYSKKLGEMFGGMRNNA